MDEQIKDFDIYGGDPSKCDHRCTSDKTSLLFIKNKFMVSPEEVFAVCKECGKSFKFVKNPDTNRWVRTKN